MRTWLSDGGRLSLQTIAYEDFDRSTGPVSSFFTEEVFPDSALPQLSDIVEAAEGRFRLVALRNDPEHYEHTLRLWQKRLVSNRAEACQIVGRELLPAPLLFASVKGNVRPSGVHAVPDSFRASTHHRQRVA